MSGQIPTGWLKQEDGSYSPPRKTCPRCGYDGGMPFHACGENAIQFESATSPKNVPSEINFHEKESDLADEILKFCEAQWPRWKILRARRDRPSTIPVGCQDDTIFASDGRVFLFELKTKSGKPDAGQLAWHKELEMLGFKVHVIRSMVEFKSIVENPPSCKCAECGAWHISKDS